MSRRFQVELHCHTAYSADGLMDFPALARVATAVGLDAIAITDHDTFEGAREFQQRAIAESRPFEIIPGEERTLADGSHVIGLFLQEELVSDQLDDLLAEIEQQGGLCLIPHPFRRKDGLFRDGIGPLESFRGRRAGFELFNAKGSGKDNRKARELLGGAWGPFGGSDAHYDCDVGECLNVVPWAGDLKSTVINILDQQGPLRILGKVQTLADTERQYAPLYYRFRKFVRLPKPLVPLAKACYRAYRNRKYGIGPKPLREVYARK